jgi:hypothetical protein
MMMRRIYHGTFIPRPHPHRFGAVDVTSGDVTITLYAHHFLRVQPEVQLMFVIVLEDDVTTTRRLHDA